jgi:hypothetical protein
VGVFSPGEDAATRTGEQSEFTREVIPLVRTIDRETSRFNQMEKELRLGAHTKWRGFATSIEESQKCEKQFGIKPTSV